MDVFPAIHTFYISSCQKLIYNPYRWDVVIEAGRGDEGEVAHLKLEKGKNTLSLLFWEGNLDLNPLVKDRPGRAVKVEDGEPNRSPRGEERGLEGLHAPIEL